MKAWPVLLAGVVAVMAAQERPGKEDDLAAAAKREAERRGRSQQPARSYGDHDLKQPDSSPSPRASPAPVRSSPAAPVPPKSQGGSEDGSRAQPGKRHEEAGRDDASDIAPDQEEFWRRRIDAAQIKLRSARVALEANHGARDDLRSKLNPMSPSFTSDTNEQLRTQSALSRLQEQEAELERTLAEAEAGLRAVQEDGRRNGAAARWLEPVEAQP